MKRLLFFKGLGFFFLIGCIFLTGCDIFSKFFKKGIEGIDADGVVIVYPTEEFVLNLSTIPDKGTIPEWRFEYSENLELKETLIDSVTKKRRYTITAKEVGDYRIVVSEKESKLTKTIIVKCRYKLTNFSLPEVKVVRLDQEFDFSKDFIFEPSEMITYDFEYIFDSNLIKYQESKKLFQANADDKGDFPIIVKDKKSGISKIIKIKVVDKFKIFEQFEVFIGVKKALPADLIQYVEENNLKVKSKEEGLTLTNDLKIIANREGAWDLLLYEILDGREIEWGKINILCSSWLFIDFYYQQRIKKETTAIMLDLGLEDELKKANNFSFKYYWEGINAEALNKNQTKVFVKNLLPTLKKPPYNWADLRLPGYEDKCTSAWKTRMETENHQEYKSVINVEKNGLNYNSIVHDTALQNSLYIKTYDKNYSITGDYIGHFHRIHSCHSFDGSASTDQSGCSHVFYLYPYNQESQYSILRGKLDEYIEFAKKSAKDYFDSNLASSMSWDLEGGKSQKTNGEFKIRRNQDNGVYSSVHDTTPKSDLVQLPSFEKSAGNFLSIKNDLQQVKILKQEKFEAIPLYPVVKKITISWESDDVTFESIQWQMSQEALSAFEKEEIHQIPNKKIILTFKEKELSNDNSILNGIICFVRFKDKDGFPIVKEIKITKED